MKLSAQKQSSVDVVYPRLMMHPYLCASGIIHHSEAAIAGEGWVCVKISTSKLLSISLSE